MVMKRRGVGASELAEKVGRSPVNISHLRCGHARGIRIDLLEKLCRELHCQPGDLLVYESADSAADSRDVDSSKGELG
ncbi:helix-turn-helix domain-containing protein [Adlercreutzia sp. R25]|nr:helix-turn-helix domain-containing protein [Adlercreutzia sp. R25]MEC4272982.1 helix-turn-helix domain-containing protein [Adlercreutzia sp. R25]